MRILDISPPISTESVSWHNRFPVEVDWHSSTERGDPTTNTSWLLHAHTGAHVDAPRHHIRGGRTVDELDLADFLGPCRVLDLRAAETIGRAQLEPADPQPGERLLLRTRNSDRGLLTADRFTEDYTGLGAEGARYLADSGVRLVGVDFLSIEEPGARAASAHRSLLGAGVAVLEGLALDGVPEGGYELVFLPLRLAGAEAAPGRAVLIPKESTS